MNGTASADLGLPPPDSGDGAAGPGSVLARLRGARGMALDDVAARLKFGTRQLEALEADDYSRLPGMTFVRGMIRSYAKLLETDAEPLLHTLERRHAPAPVAVDLPRKRIPFPDGRARSTRVYLGLSGLVLLVAGAVLYEWYFGVPEAIAPRARETAPTPASPAPAQPAPEVAEPAPAPAGPAAAPAAIAEPASAPASPAAGPAPGSATIAFFFDEESWVEVKDRSGKVLLSQLNPAGSRRTVAGDPPLSLVIGNASRVRLNYRDKTVDLTPYIKVEVARFTLN